jgi:hypothetical protein
MNLKIKWIVRLLFLIVFFTFSSCEKDLYDEAIQQKSRLTIKKISLDELSKTDNAKLFKTVDLISLKKKDEHSKIVYDSKNKFYFDDANGKEIETSDGYKSFTFQIYTSHNDSLAKVENVLFTEKSNGEYDAYRVKYDFTEKELETLSKDELSKLKVEYTYITTSSKPNKTSKASYNCFEISEWSSYPAHQGDLKGDFGYDGEWVVLAVVCGKTNTEIQTSTDTGTGNSGWSTGTFSNTGSGNTNGSTTSGGVYTSPVITPGVQFINSLNFDTKENISMLSNDAQKIVFDYLTVNSFSDASKARAKYILDHFNFFWISEQPLGTDVTIFNYLSQNGFSPESGSYIDSSITRMSQNPTFFNSIKPFLIEKQIDDTQLDTCLKEVMGQLKKATNSDIASVLAKFAANSTYSVTMKMGTMVKASSFAETQKISQNNYLITFAQDTYTGTTKLYKATALLHEIIHAYMLSVVDDYNTYPTNAPFADFPELFKLYVEKNNSNSTAYAHHEDMAYKYVDAIASALEDYQANTGVPSSLADKQVFLDMAWSGLQGTDVFNKKFPLGSDDKKRIDARIGAEQNGVYSQGQYAIGKPCN